MPGPRLRQQDWYFGISGLDLAGREFQFGHGIVLRPTFAHVFSTDVLAFERPTSPSSFHPGPWQAFSRREGKDISAELHVPKEYTHPKLSAHDVATTIITVLRLWTDPELEVQLIADCPIPDLKERKYQSPDDPPVAVLVGHRTRTFGLARAADDPSVLDSIDWVTEHWQTALNLRASRQEFNLALETFENAQYLTSSAMMLVSLWGALEAIFAPDKAELRFRVSAHIAAYLAPRGDQRLKKQREVAKLYDARSAAAHGSPKHGSEDVLSTFQLLRAAVLCMINENAVPTKDDLSRCLFAD